MRERFAIRNLGQWVAQKREELVQYLQIKGLLPAPTEDMTYLEGAMQKTLPRVRPPLSFRQSLRENLALAARRQVSGLVVEYPQPFRGGVLLGVSVGVFALLFTIMLLLLRARWAEAKR